MSCIDRLYLEDQLAQTERGNYTVEVPAWVFRGIGVGMPSDREKAKHCAEEIIGLLVAIEQGTNQGLPKVIAEFDSGLRLVEHTLTIGRAYVVQRMDWYVSARIVSETIMRFVRQELDRKRIEYKVDGEILWAFPKNTPSREKRLPTSG